MVKIRGLILLAVSLAIGLAGCGDSTGGYGIYRSSDMVTVFVPLPDTSEIAETKVVDDKALHIDIDTGEKIVSREIKLQGRLVQAVEPDETVEIHGRNRINDYAVIHLRAFHKKYKVSRSIKYHAHKYYFNKTKSGEKPKPFTDSGAFRFGDRIMAYCRLQDYMDSPPKEFEIYIRTYKIEHTDTFEHKETTIDEKNGHPLLSIEKYECIDSGKTARNLPFLLKDLEPHETVGIGEVINLGDKIVIAELKVLPPENQPPNDMIFRDR